MLKIKTTYAELYERLVGNDQKYDISYKVNESIYVASPDGNLVPVLQVIQKIPQSIIRVTLDDGRTFECSQEHLFQDESGQSVQANCATIIATTTGLAKVIGKQIIATEPTYDIEIPFPHWYVSPNGLIHHNTFFVLGIIKEWLEANKDGGVVYFDTESAVTNQMLSERGIDLTRVIKSEPETIESFRQTALAILDRYAETEEKKRQPMLLVLDSLGNLSSTKEVEDIRAEKDTRDMTKAGLIRGTFRVLRLRLAKLKVPMIVTNHVYNVVGAYVPTKALSGGSGLIYVSDSIAMLSKSKDKDKDKNVVGSIIRAKMHKSRLSRENTEVDVRISYAGGLDRYYGILDMAVDASLVEHSAGRYTFPGQKAVTATKIAEEPEKFFTKEFLDTLNENFVRPNFSYGIPVDESKMITEDEE